jgi:hypothetical protein
MLIGFILATAINVEASTVVDITTCGAISGGLEHTSANTDAFTMAFTKAGVGGTVLVPSGEYHSGPITYGANGQTLELAEGSRIIAAWDAYGDMRRDSFNSTWPLGPVRPEGPPASWDSQYAPLLYAKNKTGLQLLGTGTIDGLGHLWWALKDKTAKQKFPKNMQQRPFTIRFDSCNDVLVRDVNIVQPPFWCLVPTWTHGFKVFNVSIIAKVEGNQTYMPWNTDGIEPMYTTDVHIRDVYIENGDDSITIKSGSRNVLVEDCVFAVGHGCNVGSVQDGNIDNITFRNIKLNQTLLGGGRIKARHYQSTWMVVSNVLFENISCVDGAYPCVGNSVAEVDMGYGGGPFGKAGVTVRNATWRNINVSGGHIDAGYFTCLEDNPCTGIILDNVHSGVVKEGYTCKYASGMSTKSCVPTAPCLSSPSPLPPSPGPGPAPPSTNCTAACTKDCPGLGGKKDQCKACVKLNNNDLKVAGCWSDSGENAFIQAFCYGKGPSPGPRPTPTPGPPPMPTPLTPTPSPPPPPLPSPCTPSPGPSPDVNVPVTWIAKQKRGGLVYAVGNCWQGLPWRGDPTTTSRSAQFGNGYAASVLGGPEYVPSLFCAGNRAPIGATYNVSVPGFSVVAVAMDLERGAIEQLWCPSPKCSASVVQTTFAHEAYPHLVVSELVLVAGSARVVPAPSQPTQSYVGGEFHGARPMKCMRWRDSGSQLEAHTAFVGVISDENKKGTNITAAVSMTSTIPPTALLKAGDKITLVSSRWTSAEAPHKDPLAAVLNETKVMSQPAVAALLLESHVKAYTARGRAAAPISVEGNPTLALLLNATWYTLAAAAPRPETELNKFGIGMGIATNGYNGRCFWDQDTWIAPNFLMFGPSGAADGIINFRADAAPIAAACAKQYKYEGLDYPWDLTYGAKSSNACPEDGNAHTEIHISGDIAYFAYQRWMATHDVKWLKSTGWGLISGVAKYYASRATADGNGGLHFQDASGPDESGASTEKRGGSVYIAVVAKTIIRAAADLAATAGDTSFPVEKMRETAKNITVFVNMTLPSGSTFNVTAGWHPEYTCKGDPACTGAGYQLGDHIKQSDATMINYPFNYPVSPSTLRNDLQIYPITEKNSDMEGMNIMALMIGWRDAQDDVMAAELYHNLSTQLFEGPFYMWMEKTTGGGGAPNYLTSPGGWMQATYAGWGGLRLMDEGILLKNASPPPGCTSMSMHGVRFRGVLIDITVQRDGQLSVSASQTGLTLTFADGSKHALSEAPVTGSAKGIVRVVADAPPHVIA